MCSPDRAVAPARRRALLPVGGPASSPSSSLCLVRKVRAAEKGTACAFEKTRPFFHIARSTERAAEKLHRTNEGKCGSSGVALAVGKPRPVRACKDRVREPPPRGERFLHQKRSGAASRRVTANQAGGGGEIMAKLWTEEQAGKQTWC